MSFCWLYDLWSVRQHLTQPQVSPKSNKDVEFSTSLWM